MWLAHAVIDRHNFMALGRSRAAARRRLAAGFKLSLKTGGSSLAKWKADNGADSIEDRCNVCCTELVSDGMWRDGELLQASSAD